MHVVTAPAGPGPGEIPIIRTGSRAACPRETRRAPSPCRPVLVLLSGHRALPQETGSFQQQQPGGNARLLGVSASNLGPTVPSRRTWRMRLHD